MAHANPEINWLRLAKAIEFYKENGFIYKEVPWTAPPEAQKVTLPEYEYSEKYWWSLVGSAEQSFIHLCLEEDLPKGDFVALTPCFRYEKNLDERHQPYFAKVELFSCEDVTEENLKKKIDLCFAWFESQCGNGRLEKIQTESGVDIYLNGIEVGSYGIRTYKNFSWIFATGHAEPRFSVALKR